MTGGVSSFNILAIDVVSIHTKYNNRCRLLRPLLQLNTFIGVRYYEMFKGISTTIIPIYTLTTSLSEVHETFKLF